MITIGKRFSFEAAHFIKDHPTCGKLHGHSWVLDVMIKGTPNQDGFVIDFKELGKIVRYCLADFDHKVINEVLEDRVSVITAETLVQELHRRLKWYLSNYQPSIQPFTLGCRLQEGIDGGWAEWWEEG